MSRKSRVSLWIGVAAAVAVTTTLTVKKLQPHRVMSVTGAILMQDADPRKQAPIPNVEVTASDGTGVAETRSDNSGFFRLNLRTAIWKGSSLSLRFEHPDYKPRYISGQFADRLCVVRLVPKAGGQRVEASGPETLLANVRVRYAMKNITTVNIGSMVKEFEVANEGDVPCDRRLPCSPDRKWKATRGSKSFDAGEGHEFTNPRVSCIAGPCPFTRIEPTGISRNGRVVNVFVLNWSDTATFLFEAEVIHAMPTDAIRQFYPAVFGRNMNFTLPADAQGPSIEAEMNGSTIVFPLGPNLNLSWAECTVQAASDRSKLYSCELKPGYRLQ